MGCRGLFHNSAGEWVVSATNIIWATWGLRGQDLFYWTKDLWISLTFSHTCQHFHLKTEELFLVIWKKVYIKEAFVGNKPFPSGKVIKNLGSNLRLQLRIGPLLEFTLWVLGLYKSISIVHVLDIYVLSFSVNTCLFDAPKTLWGYILPLIQGLHPKQHVKDEDWWRYSIHFLFKSVILLTLVCPLVDAQRLNGISSSLHTQRLMKQI